MNTLKPFSFYDFLQSQDGIVLTMLLLMAFYVPNAAFLMLHTGHLDLVYVYYCGYAFSFELAILMILVNGNAKTGELTGKIYSILSGFFIVFYYLFLDDKGNYLDWHEIKPEKIFPAILLATFHVLAIWNLVDILKAKLAEAKKAKEVDPKVKEAERAISEALRVINEAKHQVNSLELELKDSKREVINLKIKHAKSERVKQQLQSELEAI